MTQKNKTTLDIAVIPGDGIGPEVTNEGIKVLRTVEKLFPFEINLTKYNWGSEYYLRNQKLYPDDAFETLKKFDAIYLGAVGDPRVPDNISVKLVIDFRFAYDQYINLRPVKGYEGAPSYLKKFEPKDIDFYVVRENTEGEYINAGGRIKKGTEDEVAIQTGIFTRKGTERVMKYAFELALKRNKAGKTNEAKVTSCTKSNALGYSMVFWDDIFKKVSQKYPTVKTNKAMIDAITMWMIKNPQDFDVIVASNLFGDIITDLASVLQGGMGFAAGGNINPERKYPSMFEPIHGSAPKYTGKNIVNPIAAILAMKMLLEFCGEESAADLVEKSISKVLKDGDVKTKDMGGNASTSEMGDAVCAAVLSFNN